ncbi:hypothetical protein [Ancylobacter terrae]|uniref:hypothetical protein n=1 Tax=Ancylobacter sp. sgz301288 TaxID=3342077 RepID=UPI003859ABEB
MTGPITWEMATALCLILGAIAGVWWRIENRITQAVGGAHTSATAAGAQALLAQQQLSEFKVQVAETYARRHDLREMRDEIIGRLDRLDGRIDVALSDKRAGARGPAKS